MIGLTPLVEQSISRPKTGWSHERCTIRFLTSLVESKREPDAVELLQRVKVAYEKEGKTLRTLERQPPPDC